jgi:hypothetical protein
VPGEKINEPRPQPALHTGFLSGALRLFLHFFVCLFDGADGVVSLGFVIGEGVAGAEQ